MASASPCPARSLLESWREAIHCALLSSFICPSILIATFIGKELDGTLAAGAAVAEDGRAGASCRQALTGQCEELREAALRDVLLRHGDQTARPVRAYPQLDKLSTAWKLSLPGFTNGLSSPVFKEVMAQHLCLPSPAYRRAASPAYRRAANCHKEGWSGRSLCRRAHDGPPHRGFVEASP